MAELRLLAREMDVALDSEAVLSWGWWLDKGERGNESSQTRRTSAFAGLNVTQPQTRRDPTEGGIEKSGSVYGAFWRTVGGPHR